MDQNLAPSRRIGVVDLARALALIAMIVYHLTWDLELYGYVAAGTTRSLPWLIFARVIASSFLFLAGVSLVLAHGREIRWRKFWIRFAQIAGAALLITVATYFTFPDAFIFFGILHQIAFASLLGLAMLGLRDWIVAAIALAIIVLPLVFQTELLSAFPVVWLGLSPTAPRSNDFVPVFPWTGVVFLGIAFTKYAVRTGILERLRQSPIGDDLPAVLLWIARHSLIIYLLHQPILLGQVWLASFLFPATVTIEQARPACERQCGFSASEPFCTSYCSCVLGAMQDEGLLTRRGDNTLNQTQRAFVGEQQQRCIAESGDPGLPQFEPETAPSSEAN